MQKKQEEKARLNSYRLYREGDPVVKLLACDLGNPGQPLVLHTLPVGPEAGQAFHMGDTASPYSCLSSRCGTQQIHQSL